MNDRYRAAPETLATEQPIAQPVSDRSLAAALGGQLGSNRRHASNLVAKPVQIPRVHVSAVTGGGDSS